MSSVISDVGSSGSGAEELSEQDTSNGRSKENTVHRGIKILFSVMGFGGTCSSIGALMLGMKKGVRKLPHSFISSGLGLPARWIIWTAPHRERILIPERVTGIAVSAGAISILSSFRYITAKFELRRFNGNNTLFDGCLRHSNNYESGWTDAADFPNSIAKIINISELSAV